MGLRINSMGCLLGLALLSLGLWRCRSETETPPAELELFVLRSVEGPPAPGADPDEDASLRASLRSFGFSEVVTERRMTLRQAPGRTVEFAAGDMPRIRVGTISTDPVRIRLSVPELGFDTTTRHRTHGMAIFAKGPDLIVAVRPGENQRVGN